MTETELLENLMEFFEDTSRTPAETKAGLESFIDRANTLADSIEDEVG